MRLEDLQPNIADVTVSEDQGPAVFTVILPIRRSAPAAAAQEEQTDEVEELLPLKEAV